MAHFEAMSARQEAVLARVEAQRARIEAQVAPVRLTPVAFNTEEIPVVSCPRVRVNVPRIRVPRVPMVRSRLPWCGSTFVLGQFRVLELSPGKAGAAKLPRPLSCAALTYCGAGTQATATGRSVSTPR